jgi:hypothetical protein
MKPTPGTITDPALDHLWAGPKRPGAVNVVRLSQREAAYLIEATLRHAEKHSPDFVDGLVEKLWAAFRG